MEKLTWYVLVYDSDDEATRKVIASKKFSGFTQASAKRRAEEDMAENGNMIELFSLEERFVKSHD